MKHMIEQYLSCPMPLTLDVRGEVSSTNTLMKELAAAGAPEGSVLIAESQSAGRGRQGRSFFSPDGSGLYLSLLLRPRLSPEDTAALTTAAAAATALAIEQVSGRSAGIKWVNDIWLEGKKVCGILCEAAFTPAGGLDYVVAGIGVNIFAPEGGFPAELSGIAGVVFDRSEAPQDARSRIAAEILNNFARFYLNMEAREYFPEYKKRCFLLGREINVLRGGEVIPATALDINDECHLLVRYRDGSEEYLRSGEVSIRPL